MSKDNAKAIDAFLTAKAQFDTMLERLQALSEDHFDVGPGSIHWGHVADANHYNELLRRVTDMAFCEGEHAE